MNSQGNINSRSLKPVWEVQLGADDQIDFVALPEAHGWETAIATPELLALLTPSPRTTAKLTYVTPRELGVPVEPSEEFYSKLQEAMREHGYLPCHPEAVIRLALGNEVTPHVHATNLYAAMELVDGQILVFGDYNMGEGDDFTRFVHSASPGVGVGFGRDCQFLVTLPN
jgi:hypothetical protein